MQSQRSYNCTQMLKSSAVFLLLILFVPLSSFANLEITCPKKENLKAPQPDGGDYVKTVTEAVQKDFPQATIKCTSCFRSVDDQKAACRSVCPGNNENGCPGTCAPPGQSQHQKMEIATCDLSGLGKGDVKKGCDFLFKLCKEKFQGRCGIGGYPGGSHHFGASTSATPSAWNQCAYLKPQMGIETRMGEQTMDKLSAWWGRIMHNPRAGERPFE